jgi:hypothetical protein
MVFYRTLQLPIYAGDGCVIASTCTCPLSGFDNFVQPQSPILNSWEFYGSSPCPCAPPSDLVYYSSSLFPGGVSYFEEEKGCAQREIQEPVLVAVSLLS